jgi:4,5-dihydroxyphthalate decarboxylase
MLMDGEIDAAIFGNDLPSGEGITPLIPNHAEADRLWHHKHGFVPINHVAVMHRTVAGQHPDSVRAVYQLFKQGKAATANPAEVLRRLPDGIAALRGPLEMTLAFCDEQKLLPRKLDPDEIFADCLAFLGDDAR